MTSSPPPKLDSTPPRASSPSGIIIDGKYLLQNEVGRGAMGTVFMAQDTILKRKVAVKFLLPELAKSTECVDRFYREAVAMASIRNNNVAHIFSYGEYSSSPFFIMEYLDGETVEHLVDSHNRRGFFIPVADVIEIVIQALGGIGAIHKAGAVHRDVKPANMMMVDDPMRVVIMDFGLVRTVRVEDHVKALAGTPAYIAPELVEGLPGADTSPLTDIYSMGATAYELLTGAIPFIGNSWIEIVQKHVTEIPVPPSVRRAGLPEEIDNVVARAMSKDPRERYQSCEEFAFDLIEIRSLPLPGEKRPSFMPKGSDPARGRSSSARSSPTKAAKSTPTGGSRGKLLVADPDPAFRAHVSEAVQSAVPSCRVRSAADGVMALSLLREFEPHAILLDLDLPEINGVELIATIRGEPEFDHVKIVVATSRGGLKEDQMLRTMGVTSFLIKPVDAETLVAVLRPVLERPVSVSKNPNSPA